MIVWLHPVFMTALVGAVAWLGYLSWVAGGQDELEEYRPQPASNRDLVAATTARPSVKRNVRSSKADE
jgi:hypothetical protein